MKQFLPALFCLMASPALAHHEVVVVTSMLPLISALVAVPLAGFTAWYRHRKK
jgi:hypothetical protein